LDNWMTAPAMTFLAPPTVGGDHDDASDHAPFPTEGRTGRPARAAARGTEPRRRPESGLRMTRGAREAATGMKVGDADIRRCLDAPDDVSPDENTPSRTRFRRGNLVVLAGADGMVLRIDRRRR
jgi:hypothetical protein